MDAEGTSVCKIGTFEIESLQGGAHVLVDVITCYFRQCESFHPSLLLCGLNQILRSCSHPHLIKSHVQTAADRTCLFFSVDRGGGDQERAFNYPAAFTPMPLVPFCSLSPPFSMEWKVVASSFSFNSYFLDRCAEMMMMDRCVHIFWLIPMSHYYHANR